MSAPNQPTRAENTVPLVHAALLGSVLLLYLLLTLTSFVWIDEDAYINFRIAENLAAGHGYVFNIGGERIELGSSVLWQFLLVPLTFLPCPLVITAKLVGVCFGCVSLVLLYRLGLRFLKRPRLAILPVLATTVSVQFVVWNQGGLATALYGVLVLVYALVLTSKTNFDRWGWPASLLVFARPEAMLLCAAVVPALASPQRRRSVVRGALLVLGVLALATVARIAYFHDFLSHPFYVKFKTDPGSGLSGLLNVAQTHHLAFFGLPLAAACVTRRFWNRNIAHLVSLSVVLIAWSVYAAEIKPYFRHLVPALPLVSLLLILGATHLASFVGRAGRALPLLYGWAWVLTLAFLFTVPVRYDRREPNPLHAWVKNFADQPVSSMQAVLQKMTRPEARTLLDENSGFKLTLGTNYQAGVGQFIAANYPPGITIVYDQMGQTPYYAGADKWFVDSWGLAHRSIGLHVFGKRARHSALLTLYRKLADEILAALYPDEERTVPAHAALREIFARQPELILINRFILVSEMNTLPHRIANHPRLAREYEHRYILGDWVNVYERRGVPRAPLIVPKGVAVEILTEPRSK